MSETMLQRSDGSSFATGRARYRDRESDQSEPTAKIYIRVIPRGLPGPIFAQLDTGAPWSIFDPEVSREFADTEVLDEGIALQTRFGSRTGRLARIALTLPAEEGEELTVQATVFLCDDWPEGKNFLGYSGLIEKIRFALDPEQNLFYFGG
jgi:hypothetical protein